MHYVDASTQNKLVLGREVQRSEQRVATIRMNRGIRKRTLNALLHDLSKLISKPNDIFLYSLSFYQ